MKLIILSAPSGAGKSTIINALMERGLKLEFSISACNRKARAGEEHAIDYYFLSTTEFQERIKQDAFIEWEEVYENHFYGTLKSELERIEERGNHMVFDIDIVGGLNLKKQFGDQALALFIMPPSVEELEKRLRSRGTDSDENIKIRIAKAEHEISFAKEFDKIVINKNIESAITETESIIRTFINQ